MQPPYFYLQVRSMYAALKFGLFLLLLKSKTHAFVSAKQAGRQWLGWYYLVCMVQKLHLSLDGLDRQPKTTRDYTWKYGTIDPWCWLMILQVFVEYLSWCVFFLFSLFVLFCFTSACNQTSQILYCTVDDNDATYNISAVVSTVYCTVSYHNIKQATHSFKRQTSITQVSTQKG